MAKEKALFLIMLLLAVFLFIYGFYCLFYTKKIRDWNVNRLNWVHKKRLVLFYRYQLKIAENMLSIKIGAIVSILISIILFWVLIYFYRHG